MSKKRAYIRKRRSVHLRCRQKAENARKVRSRQKPVQSPESASVTFQAAATLWHRTNVARYKGATAVKYENLLRSHILPELGARQLEEINTLLLADFMNAKLHCGRLDHSGGLSSSYVRSMMLLVLDIMEFAAAGGPVSARENHAPDTGGESTGGGDPGHRCPPEAGDVPSG